MVPKRASNKFVTNTVRILGGEIIKKVKYIHHKKMIHRDLKPQNIVMGKEKDSKEPYIIDFGLAKTYDETDKYR